MLKNGSRGDQVKSLQQNLSKLGYEISPDGVFGLEHGAGGQEPADDVRLHGRPEIVGPGTEKLISAQLGYGWNAKAPDAKEKAMRAQGKAPGGAPQEKTQSK